MPAQRLHPAVRPAAPKRAGSTRFLGPGGLPPVPAARRHAIVPVHDVPPTLRRPILGETS
jgi:hypothetical protein